MKGKVYLIGAGPGDAGLITKKGYQYLSKSDVVVYDRLVNPELLENIKKDARLIYVGKTAKHHTKTQDEINEIIYQEAKKGNVVARLKGGDPYVFGRGGEEGEYLYDREIEFEEVPGVTSAIGGLAYAGIPITHRGIATSFHVITGHLQEGSDDLNWEALAKLDGTLVFLMGVGNLKKITSELVKHGKNPKTKAALVNWGTTTKQRVVQGELSNIYDVAREAKIQPPSLIVIGDVVGLRDKLKFHERKALFGKNIVIMREEKSARETIAKFRELGANVISFPTIETKEIESEEILEEIENISKYNYLVFTSVNGVDIFFKNLFKAGKDSRDLANLKVAVVGPKTGNAVKKYGISPDYLPDKYKAEDLIDLLGKVLSKDDKVLIPRAKIGRAILIDELEKISDVKEIEVYETLSVDIEDEKIEELNKLNNFDLVFTSSSTFLNFKNILKEKDGILEKARIVSIGPITSKTIRDAGYDIDIEADDYTIDGIIEKLV